MEPLVTSPYKVKLTSGAPSFRDAQNVKNYTREEAEEGNLEVSQLRLQAILGVIPDCEHRHGHQAADKENDEEACASSRSHRDSLLDTHPHADKCQYCDYANEDIAPNDKWSTCILE